MYHYAGNNPVKYTDPDGNAIHPFVFVAIGIAVEIGVMMLPKLHNDGFLFFDNSQPQRIGGYYNFYESFTSNKILCNIDSLRTDFKNSKGLTSSIWLWKGNYNLLFNGGWHNGAEVGAYDPHGGADDSMLESVSFTLTDKTTKKSVNRSVAGQYWTNRFDTGKSTPANLILTATLNFNNEADAESYCNALMKGFDNERSNQYFESLGRNQRSVNFSATRNGKTVEVIFE